MGDSANVPDYKTGLEVIPGTDNPDELEDGAVVKLILKREGYCQDYYSELKKKGDENRRYYKGDQIDKTKLKMNESPIVINRILTSIETIIPIATEKTPEPILVITPSTKNNKKFARKLESKLKNLWEVEIDMDKNLKMGLRNYACIGYICLKILWDEEKKEIDCILKPMNSIFFPRGYATVDECPFIGEYVESTIGETIMLFPEKEAEIRAEVKKMGQGDASDDSKITRIEYWQDDMYACIFGKLLLKKASNPYYKWKDESNDDEMNDEGNPVSKNDSELFNIFSKPKKPYLWLNEWSFGDSMVDETTLIEVGKTLQDNINKRKRQIELNADNANGMKVIAGKAMTKQQAQSITNQAVSTIYLPDAQTAAGVVEYVQGKAYDEGTFEDMQDSKQEIDNVMGTHSTTRGQQSPEETATGRQILLQRDVGRLGGLYTSIESLAQTFYEYCLQIMYVKYDEKHPILNYQKSQSLSDLDKEDFIISKEFEDKKMRVLVQQNSVAPDDKYAMQENAINLFKAGAMSLKDLYEQLDYPNPEKFARNAMMEKIDPFYLFPEIKNPSEFDPRAIIDLKSILSTAEGEEPRLLGTSRNISFLQRYITTFTDYIKGEDIDSDMPSYSEISYINQLFIGNYLTKLTNEWTELLNQHQQSTGGDPSQPPAPSQSKLPPTNLKTDITSGSGAVGLASSAFGQPQQPLMDQQPVSMQGPQIPPQQ